MHISQKWTSQLKADLVRLWTAGVPRKLICRELNAKGETFSPAGVTCKAHRLKLGMHPTRSCYRRTVVLAFVGMVATFPNTSYGAASCSIDTFPWEEVRDSAPEGFTVVEVDSPAAFIAGINAMPPVSDVTADQVFIAHSGKIARVFFITKGCVTIHADITWHKAQELLGIEN